MVKLVKEQMNTIKYCHRKFLKQQLSFKLVTVALGYPILWFLLNVAMKFSNVEYLTNEMTIKLLGKPVTWLITGVFLLVIGVYSLYELSLLTTFVDYDTQNKKASGYSIIKVINSRFLSFFNRKRIGIILYGIVVLPILSVMNLSLYIYSFSSAKGLIKLSDNTKVYLLIAAIVLIIMALSGIFTFNIMLYEDKNCKDAIKGSINILKRNLFKVLIYIVICNIVVAIIMGIVYLVYSLLVILGVKLLDRSEIGIAIYLSTLRGLSGILTIVMWLIYISVTFFVINAMYRVFSEKEERELLEVPQTQIGNTKLYRIKFWSIVAITLCLNMLYIYHAVVDNPFNNFEIISVPEITAHRGSSFKAPENTKVAFEYAIEDLADYIELDVKQTGDGIVIALHDASLRRTTGVNKDIWKVRYEYVSTLDAGSWFHEDFADERIPTLEEVLIMCRGKIKLNIEIKPTGHDNKLEQAVVDLLEQYDMVDECVITSMKYDVLKEVKRINPKIKTGYIMSAAYGKFYNMQAADFFSVNYSFVTKKLVDLIHNSGKEIHVWTVNGSNEIEEMARIGVDNIITDTPVKCREIVYSKYSNEKIVDILKYVFE